MNTVLLVPLGTVPAEVWSALTTALSAAFGCSCLIGSPMGMPTHAYDPGRRQYRADVVVDSVEVRGGSHVLAIADADMFVPGMNFVFGLADPPRGRAVLALARLRPEWYRGPPDAPLFLTRLVKEAIHELGHTAGLDHCRNRRCAMAFSNSLRDTDFKNARFCDRCQRRLRSPSSHR